MKLEWKNFLIDNGAEFEGDALVSFGNPERERRIPPQGDIICDLSHMGLISVHGDDASSFLQNLLTNDINNVSETSAQLSAWCTPKGRVLASFYIFQRNGTYYISVSADLLEATIKRLRMYVLMAKVTLEDASESLVHFGFAGSRAEQELADIIGDIPQNVNDVVQKDGLTIIRQAGSVSRFELVGELDDAKYMWGKLNVRSAPVHHQSWDYLSIEAGIATITEASSEAWIPQMLNYHIIDGVSFKKGCYPGQEVVARLKYLGKSKRRIYRLQIDTDKLPLTGDKLFAKGSDADAGTIVNAVINPAGKAEVLAVLKIAEADKSLRLGSGDGPSVTMLDLPYRIEE
jgi:folate-binding protein YgfZ